MTEDLRSCPFCGKDIVRNMEAPLPNEPPQSRKQPEVWDSNEIFKQVMLPYKFTLREMDLHFNFYVEYARDRKQPVSMGLVREFYKENSHLAPPGWEF